MRAALRRTDVLQWVELDDDAARAARAPPRRSLALRPREGAAAPARLRRRLERGADRELPANLFRRSGALRPVPAARRSHRVRRALLAVARPARPHGRANDRPKTAARADRSARNISRARWRIASSPNCGRFAPISAREATHERHRNAHRDGTAYRSRFPILANSTYLVSHSMGAAPLGARARWKPIGMSGRRRARGVGTLVAADRRDRRRHRRDRRCAPGLGLSWVRTCRCCRPRSRRCIDFRGDTQRSRLRVAAVSVADVRVARMGTLRRRVRVVESDDGRTIPTERIVAAITEKTAIAVISHAYYVSGALADVGAIQRTAAPSARCSASTPTRRRASIRTTSPHWISISPPAARTSGSAADPGCGWIYVKPSLRESAFVRRSPDGWRTSGRSRSNRRRSCTPPSMYRFGHGTPTIPGYVVAAPGHDMIGDRSASRGSASTTFA